MNPLQNVVAIGAGSDHSAAVKSSRDKGTVWTWGLNFNGQLGNGGHTNSNVPVGVREF